MNFSLSKSTRIKFSRIRILRERLSEYRPRFTPLNANRNSCRKVASIRFFSTYFRIQAVEITILHVLDFKPLWYAICIHTDCPCVCVTYYSTLSTTISIPGRSRRWYVVHCAPIALLTHPNVCPLIWCTELHHYYRLHCRQNITYQFVKMRVPAAFHTCLFAKMNV